MSGRVGSEEWTCPAEESGLVDVVVVPIAELGLRGVATWAWAWRWLWSVQELGLGLVGRALALLCALLLRLVALLLRGAIARIVVIDIGRRVLVRAVLVLI